MNKPIVPHLLIASLVSATLTAAPITWGPATDVSTGPGNSSDVSTTGTLVEAYNGVGNDQIDTATTVTVNGVDFTPTTSLLNADPKNGGTNNFSSGTDGGDAAYDSLLSTLEYGGGTDLVTLTVGDGDGDGSITGAGLLVMGNSYEIQVWYVDDRATTDARVTPVGDGNDNKVSLNDQFAIGTFTADGTTQDITLESPDFGQSHINAYQIRAIAPNAEATLSTAADPVATAYTVDVNFDKDVNGLEDSDFVVSNGVASGTSPATGPASVYTVTITPTAPGFVTVDLPAGTTETTDLDPSLASNTLSTLHVPAGTEQATVTLSTLATEPVFAPYTVDVVFSEDINGLDAGDFLVIGGTASDVMPTAGPASVYTVTITPSVDGDIEVTLPAASVVDIDDNLPNEVSNTLLTDYLPPTIPSVELFNPVAGSVVSGPYTVEVFFSEFVTGLEDSDFVVTNGTASMLDPTTGDSDLFTVLITPTATGLVSVSLPAGTVDDDDGEGQTNTASNVIYANNVPAGTYTSGSLNLSGRDVLGIGAGETSGFFTNPKTFDSVSDLSLNDIPWTDGVNSGTFDLSLNATGSLGGILRGGKGAFGTAVDVNGSALVDPGETVILDSLVVSDLQGDLAGMVATNIQLVAIYLGNKTNGDEATINGLIGDGAVGGDTIEEMRNDIELASSATIVGTGSGNGYSINGIDITFEVALGPLQTLSAELNGSNEFVVTYSGLDTDTTYELRYSPDILTPFTLVPGTTKMPAASTDTFTDTSPTLPGKGFYQLWTP